MTATPLFVENNPLRKAGQPAESMTLRLMLCIQSAEREGFWHLRAAYIQLLKNLISAS